MEGRKEKLHALIGGHEVADVQPRASFSAARSSRNALMTLAAVSCSEHRRTVQPLRLDTGYFSFVVARIYDEGMPLTSRAVDAARVRADFDLTPSCSHP